VTMCYVVFCDTNIIIKLRVLMIVVFNCNVDSKKEIDGITADSI